MPSKDQHIIKDEPNSSTLSSRTSSIDSSYNIDHVCDPQYQDSIQPSLNFSRLAYNLEQFNETYEVIHRKSTPSKKMFEAMRPSCSPENIKRSLKSLLPITEWLSNYNWKSDLIADFVTGITIAVFQVPQSESSHALPHFIHSSVLSKVWATAYWRRSAPSTACTHPSSRL